MQSTSKEIHQRTQNDEEDHNDKGGGRKGFLLGHPNVEKVNCLTNQWDAYPLLNNKIPGPATQSIANEELDEIKWDVEDYVIEPDHTSPTPSNPFNCSKAPICIDSN